MDLSTLTFPCIRAIALLSQHSLVQLWSFGKRSCHTIVDEHHLTHQAAKLSVESVLCAELLSQYFRRQYSYTVHRGLRVKQRGRPGNEVPRTRPLVGYVGQIDELINVMLAGISSF